MALKVKEVTLLKKELVFDTLKIEPLKKYGLRCAATDLAILSGCTLSETINVKGDSSLKGSSVYWAFSSCDKKGNPLVCNLKGNQSIPVLLGTVDMGIRPVLKVNNFDEVIKNAKENESGILEITYGEYPQYAVERKTKEALEFSFDNKFLDITKKEYTINRSNSFGAAKFEEYRYNRKKYVRVRVSPYYLKKAKMSNGQFLLKDECYWFEVSPITWFVDVENKLLISKNCLISGIHFSDKKYYDDFKQTEIYKFLNQYFVKEIVPIETKKISGDIRRKNPYKLNLNEVSEEDIIRGAIESGVSVFLHGASSEGKSSRVKQIDPTCEIIYLRNASPESLNGKSVYNEATGEMIDIKPSWLKKLEKKCKDEPDRLHVVFFDEITNAAPSLQGIAFNIVLDREVNGIWKLPENARVVAAGNDMEDSLAANRLSEPFFNRFAHVYIKTTTKGWLKWASENNIHPAIIDFVKHTNGRVLRSKYDGISPNADPRKWEMASKMLYKTNNPEMIRSLVGEDIMQEFIEFCQNEKEVVNENDKKIDNIENIDNIKNIDNLMNKIKEIDKTSLQGFDVIFKSFQDRFIIGDLWSDWKLEDSSILKDHEYNNQVTINPGYYNTYLDYYLSGLSIEELEIIKGRLKKMENKI